MDMPDIDEIVNRTKKHAYRDGIGEIHFGATVALMGLMMVAEGIFRIPLLFHTPLPSFWAIAMAVVAMGSWLLGRWLVPAVKGRLVYPRTGFVAYRQPEMPKPWLIWGIGCLVGILMVGVMAIVRIQFPPAVEWLPLGFGIAVSAFLLSLGSRMRLRRFWVLAGFSALAGLAASLSGLGEGLGAGVYFVAMGLAMAAGGALALRSYLHQAPKPEEQ